jgi:hypothetical protein
MGNLQRQAIIIGSGPAGYTAAVYAARPTFGRSSSRARSERAGARAAISAWHLLLSALTAAILKSVLPVGTLVCRGCAIN